MIYYLYKYIIENREWSFMINKLRNRFKLKYLKYVIIFIIIVVLIYGFWLFYNKNIKNNSNYEEFKITSQLARYY